MAVSGAHSVSLISAGISYGKAPGLIQLAHAPFSTPAITKARLVYHPTYSGNFAYLEVYLAQAKAVPLSVNLIGGQGWTLVAPSTAGAVPSGYSTKELTLAEGKIVGNVKGTAEDIAIGGNAADLASKRGQIGDAVLVRDISDLNTYRKAGEWFFSDMAVGENFPLTLGGFLSVSAYNPYLRQQYKGRNSSTIFERRGFINTDGTMIWSNWFSVITTSHIGDGITVNNDIISVPEYSGATASIPGTSGLVPPAAAGEQGHALTGGGGYKLFAPDGYGLGTQQGNLVSDANEALQAGWYGPKTNQADTVNFYEKNHPLLVLPRNTWGTVQMQIVHGKIAIRELWDGVWENWGLASVGNADTATKLATARTIALSGDVTASGAFDGSGNLALTAALKNSGATAGAYGPGANATPAFGGTFNVPQITVDAKGRITAAATRTVKIPANPVATQSANGLLSAADKKKLDGFATSGIMRINYKSYQDFTLNANFTMPYDGIATLFVTGAGWGGLSLTVDGIEVGRARLYGEDNPSPCDSVAAIVRSGKIVKGITKEGHGISGHVRCFKCE